MPDPEIPEIDTTGLDDEASRRARIAAQLEAIAATTNEETL